MSTATITSRPNINFKNLNIDEHAVQRAIERFKRKNRQDALQYCKCLLGNSRYIGETTCERGNRAHMFVAPNKVAIYITLDYKEIKTIMKIKDKSYIVYQDKTSDSDNTITVDKDNPLQDKLIKLYQKEFNKYDRLDKKYSKEYEEFKLKNGIEIAQLRYEAFITRSKKKREELLLKVKEIEEVFIDNELKLKKLQDDKRKISRALSTLLNN